jgi:hypothetical protein
MHQAWGRRGTHKGFGGEARRDQQEDLDEGEGILKRILGEQDGAVWNGFIWLGIRISGGFL